MGKKPVTIRNYRPSDPVPDVFGHESAEQYDKRVDAHRAQPSSRSAPTEPEKITATVTPEPTEEDPWKDLEIPPFLRRVAGKTTEIVGPARAPAATSSAGGPSGPTSDTKVIPGLTGAFDHFRVDPNEIESKIKQEADRRWRAWVPTKEHLSRPRKSYYLKQVRKEYYP